MSLREDMWKYEQITGESAEHVPIIKLGAFLDGYEMGLKTLEQQSCEDCISRKEVLKYLDKMPSELTSDGRRMVRRRTLEEYISDTLPPVTPQPYTGRWMRKTKVDGVYDISGVKTWGIKCQCNRCDFTTTVIEDFGYYSYCPNCGAKMEVEE